MKSKLFKKSNILAAFLCVLVPGVIFGSLELFLYLMSRIYPNKFFFANQVSRQENRYFVDPNDKRVRVAVFGGSSSEGYGSEISFSDIAANQLKATHVIHNHAQAGEPFFGYQAEKLKKLIPYYDVFVVYAGHNEIHSYIKNYVKSTGQNFQYPNGKILTPSQVLQYDKAHQMRNRLAVSSGFKSSSFIGYLESAVLRMRSPVFLGALPHIVNRKIFNGWFSSSASSPVNQVKASEPLQRYPYYSNDLIYSLIDEDKSKMLASFQSEVLSIISMIPSDKRLIISTVLSNDLYPPILNSSSLSFDSDKFFSGKISTLYSNIFSNKIPQAGEIEMLPAGSHKNYLLTVTACLKADPKSSKILDFALNPLCISDLREARRSDSLPYRVIPEINDFIRSLKGQFSNVSIIDPERELNKAISSRSYLSNFVDFQHPSPQGHLLISDLLLTEFTGDLYNQYQVKDVVFRKLLCEDIHRQNVKVNIEWLNIFRQISSTPALHEFYLKQAMLKLKNCSR